MFLPIIQAGAAASMAASRSSLTATHIFLSHMRREGSVKGLANTPRYNFRPEPLATLGPAPDEPRTFDSASWTGRAGR